jgi:hypothetical protein
MYLQTTLAAEEGLEEVQLLLKEQTMNMEEEFEDQTTTKQQQLFSPKCWFTYTGLQGDIFLKTVCL